MAHRLLLHSLSPFSRKVRIYLTERGVPFETVEIHSGAQRIEVLALNPRGELPVLVSHGLVVVGSSLICDWADAQTAPPHDPAAAMEIRTLERLSDTYADALQFLCHLLRLRRPEVAAAFPEAARALAFEVERLFAFLDRKATARAFLAGTFSRADAAFLPHVTALDHMGFAVPVAQTGLHAWLARLLERPSVRDDATLALAAFRDAAANPDPFFRPDRIHWRSERVEWAVRFGLGGWLAEEARTGRAFFSAPFEADAGGRA
jgi:glutathione S-transferase